MGKIAAAPKFTSLHVLLLLHSLEHGFSAFWALRCSTFRCLSFAGFKSLHSHIFCEASCISEVLELALHLGLKHFVFSQTQHQQRIGRHIGRGIVQPWVKLAFLRKYMNCSIMKIAVGIK